MTKRRDKQLNSEDKKIWKQVTDTVTPRQINSVQDQQDFENAMKQASFVKNPGKETLKQSSSVSAYIPPSSQKRSLKKSSVTNFPPLAGYNRREKSRLSRGLTEIDGRLDLHGMNQDQAYRALHIFIGRAVASKWKNVLVITGKGKAHIHQGLKSNDYMSVEPTGVLRRKVPQWLSEPSIRGMIIGYETASPSHGGSGALFVRLRKSN